MGVTDKRNRRRFIAISLTPTILIMFVFSYFCLFYCLRVSFLKWNMLGDPKWVGFANYLQMLTNPDFWNSLKVTVVYSLWSVPLCVILGLMIGLVLKNVTKGRSFFRVMFFLPVVISMVVACYIWRWMFSPSQGLVNFILYSLGAANRANPPHWMQWILDPKGGSFAALLTVGVWKRIGYNGVLFLAGLLNIPGEYYEAATLEGASAFSKFRRITLPLLSPTTYFVLTLEVISALKVSVSPMVLTNGGPVNSTESMVLYIYKEAFENFRMGYASAVAVFVFLLILGLTVLQNKVGEKKVYYQ